MFGKKKFKVTSSKVDPAGKKTTITISTDDESIVRKLLDSKKDAMDAEFKETKKDFGTNKKNPKPTSKSTKKTSLKVLPKPVEKSKPKLSRKSIVGKAEIKHNTRNLNDSQVSWSNHHSFNGTRGTNMKKSYENYRHKIEFSGLSNIQKSKLLDKLYKLYVNMRDIWA